MPSALVIKGRLFNWGDKVMLNRIASDNGICPPGTIVELFMWHPEHEDTVGVYSNSPISNWHDLDGEVPSRRGWWLTVGELAMYIDFISEKVQVVAKDFEFNGISLKDKECRVLASIERTGLVFVEFDEDIGGCSADGLGKRGHCAAIPQKFLKDMPKKASKNKS